MFISCLALCYYISNSYNALLCDKLFSKNKVYTMLFSYFVNFNILLILNCFYIKLNYAD